MQDWADLIRQRTKWRVTILVLLSFGLFSPQVLGQSNFSNLGITDLDRAATVFERAVAEQDLTAIGAFYTEDAAYFAPDGAIIVGRDNIQQIYANNFAAGNNVLDIVNARWEGDENRATMVWTWNLSITPRGQRGVLISGRSMISFVKTLFGWKISTEMFQLAPQPAQN